LQAAAATVDRVAEAERRRIHDALLLGRQKATCAETLWANGHTAEGLSLAAEALEATLTAARALGRNTATTRRAPSAEGAKTEDPKTEDPKTEDPKTEDPKTEDPRTEDPRTEDPKTEDPRTEDPRTEESKADESRAEAPPPSASVGPEAAEPGWDEVLRARLSKAELEAIESAASRAREKLPILDRDVSPAHAELFVDLMRCRYRADRAISPGAMTHAELRWTRVLRAAAALVVTGLMLVGAYLALRTPTGTFATASDFFQRSPQFAPEMAVDGSASTYWLLPDGATGWLEVSTSPSRRVGRVRLLNTVNPPWADRGTHEYQLEIYANGELARTIEGRFEWTDTPQPIDHDVGLDGVERVRFVVRSHHRVGAGLAELTLD
jgi:hypothetical protein